MKSPRILSLVIVVALLTSASAVGGNRPSKPRKKNPRSAKEASVAAETKARLAAKKTAAFIPESVDENHPRNDSPAEAQHFFLQKRLAPGQRELPVQKYVEAASQIKAMAKHSTAAEAPGKGFNVSGTKPEAGTNIQPGLQTWSPLGPGNIGGRTRAMAIDPVNPQVMYAGGVGGGVWKTQDGGNSWNPLTDMLGNIAVTALAIDPANHNVVYAGTGEGFSNLDAIPGAGVFKSADAGATWTHLASGYDPNFQYIFKLIVSPHDSSVVYAATSTGIWESAGGQPFVPIFFTQGTSDGCSDLVIRADQPDDYLFAACGIFQQSTIYRNTSALSQNNRWTAVFTADHMGRTSLALAPSNPAIIYAMGMQIGQLPEQNYSVKAVYRSTNNGDTNSWTAQSTITGNDLNSLLLTNPLAARANDCNQGLRFNVNQGWYDNTLAVDPTNPDRVWAGGIDLFRSDDGGLNFSLASYWWAKDTPQYLHPDQHAIVFHPQYNGASNRTMFVTNDGGLFKTDDALAQTASGPMAECDANRAGFSWSNINNGYGVTQFYQGAAYPGGSEYLGGTQDNGTLKGTAANGQSWNQLLGGDGGFVKVNPSNTSMLYASHPGLKMERSFDGGANWVPGTNGIDDFGLFVTPFEMDPVNPNRLWTGGAYVWRTNNAAGNWQQASALTAGSGLVSAIAIAPSNPDVAAVGMSDGFVLTTTQATTAGPATVWTGITPKNGFVSSLAYDPTNSSILYATISTVDGGYNRGHVFKSTDNGGSWQSIDGSGAEGVPNVPVNAIVVNPADANRLYVATDSGVFVSLDGGQHWAFENTGFANVVTDALQVEPQSKSLFAFTHGRGVWKVALQPEALGVTPSVLDFGLQFRGHVSTASTILVRNLSDNPVAVNSIQVGGTFNQTNNCTTLAAHGSCSINVTVTPANTGLTTSTLTISSDTAGASFAIPVRATGYSGPSVSLSTTNIDFGTVTATPTAARTVVLTNTGDADLHIVSIFSEFGNNGFTRQSQCADILAPGASCNINIRWEGQSSPATLDVNTDAVTSPDKITLAASLAPTADRFNSIPAFNFVPTDLADLSALQLPIDFQHPPSAQATYRVDGQPRVSRFSMYNGTITLLPQDIANPGQHTLTLYDPMHNPHESAPGNLIVTQKSPVDGMAFDPFTRLIFARPIIQQVNTMPGINDRQADAKNAINNTVLVFDADTKSVVRRVTIPRRTGSH